MLTKNQALYLHTLKEINDLERNRFTYSFFTLKMDLYVHDQKVKRLNDSLKYVSRLMSYSQLRQVETIRYNSVL